jgi:hypothetical protein
MIDKGLWSLPLDKKAQLAESLALQRVRSTGFRASVNDFTDRVADKVHYLEEMARYRREFVEANAPTVRRRAQDAFSNNQENCARLDVAERRHRNDAQDGREPKQVDDLHVPQLESRTRRGSGFRNRRLAAVVVELKPTRAS